MKKNVPRFFAWLSLLFGLAGGPVSARLGRPVPPGILRWSVTAGAALMIISFFWFPRRTEHRPPRRNEPVTAKPAAKRKAAPKRAVSTKKTPKTADRHKAAAVAEPLIGAEAVGRRARKRAQASEKRNKR